VSKDSGTGPVRQGVDMVFCKWSFCICNRNTFLRCERFFSVDILVSSDYITPTFLVVILLRTLN
jgi:hypothetical protein